MNLNKTIAYVLRLLAPVILTASMSGCITEDTDSCLAEPLTFTVRAYDRAGNELTQSEVSSVYLYYFDTHLNFMGSLSTQIGETVALEVIPGEDMHIVALGNLNGNTDTVTGGQINEFGIGLRPRTRADFLAFSPDDIFWGSLTFSPDLHQTSGQTNIELPIRRKVGSLTLTVKGLQEFAGYNDPDYHIVVGETPSVITFGGTFTGSKVTYLETGDFTEPGEIFYVAPFNIIPENGIYIDIYHGYDRVAGVSHVGNFEAIVVNERELTNVLIDLSRTGETGEMNVQASLTEWGHEQVWKEF